MKLWQDRQAAPQNAQLRRDLHRSASSERGREPFSEPAECKRPSATLGGRFIGPAVCKLLWSAGPVNFVHSVEGSGRSRSARVTAADPAEEAPEEKQKARVTRAGSFQRGGIGVKMMGCFVIASRFAVLRDNTLKGLRQYDIFAKHNYTHIIICIYIYIYMYYVYMYAYLSLSLYIYIYIHILLCIYVYTYNDNSNDNNNNSSSSNTNDNDNIDNDNRFYCY